MVPSNITGYLPTLNACLNGMATILIVTAGWAIKQRKEDLHRACMSLAGVISIFFLASYLVYHHLVGSVPFKHEGVLRWIYFFILVPHIILAAVQVPLILLAVFHGFKNNRSSHKKIVHWAYPIWLYVSVSGVIIYLMLYHMP